LRGEAEDGKGRLGAEGQGEVWGAEEAGDGELFAFDPVEEKGTSHEEEWERNEMEE
jgi:hypothetical protein